jgi:hypothetical protein
MDIQQEPKYDVNKDGKIINRATGLAIPDDEPIFILRAKDRKAFTAIMKYLNTCSDPEHGRAVMDRAKDFHTFSIDHPERMNEPTT